ncbi:MAG: ATPase P [Betaproteobacteria bacterium]|nr:ATPase P [Betaproteobacteria bacterium]
MRIEIPGVGTLDIEHVVLDFNGTLAVDGGLLPGVAQRLGDLARHLRIHVVTADTFGSVARELAGLPCEIVKLATHHQGEAKLAYVRRLGLDSCACIGNGFNDRLMLRESVLGIGVIQGEGAAVPALVAARVVCHDIFDALDLLRHPKRLAATLRD